MDQWLTWSFLEGGGGALGTESYELGLYIAARHTSMDCWEKRKHRGYLFMTGDENPYPYVSKKQVHDLVGDALDDDLPLARVVDELQRTFEPFFLIPDPPRAKRCERAWRDALGDHVVVMEEPGDTCLVTAGLMALCEGAVSRPRRAREAPARQRRRPQARGRRGARHHRPSRPRADATEHPRRRPRRARSPRATAPAATSADPPMTARREAHVVVDLGFGDAGKGTITDHLTRARGAHTVVRFNGGAQAGHNVVTDDGRHHTFAQLGAGSFSPGVRTWLSRHVVVHPTALIVEAWHLARSGVADPLSRVTVSAAAKVVTPFHQAATRLRELARGDARHGSCGVGVGEVMRDATDPRRRAARGRPRRRPRALRRALAREQARKRAELDDVLRAVARDPEAARDVGAFENDAVIDAWIDALAPWRAGCACGRRGAPSPQMLARRRRGGLRGRAGRAARRVARHAPAHDVEHLHLRQRARAPPRARLRRRGAARRSAPSVRDAARCGALSHRGLRAHGGARGAAQPVRRVAGRLSRGLERPRALALRRGLLRPRRRARAHPPRPPREARLMARVRALSRER